MQAEKLSFATVAELKTKPQAEAQGFARGSERKQVAVIVEVENRKRWSKVNTRDEFPKAEIMTTWAGMGRCLTGICRRVCQVWRWLRLELAAVSRLRESSLIVAGDVLHLVTFQGISATFALRSCRLTLSSGPSRSAG